MQEMFNLNLCQYLQILSVYCLNKGSFPRNTKMLAKVTLTQRWIGTVRHFVRLKLCNFVIMFTLCCHYVSITSLLHFATKLYTDVGRTENVLPAIVARISELLNNRASTVEELYQRLLKNCASDCWRIMPVTLEEFCQWLLMNRGNGCWTVAPAVYFSLFNLLWQNPYQFFV